MSYIKNYRVLRVEPSAGILVPALAFMGCFILAGVFVGLSENYPAMQTVATGLAVVSLLAGLATVVYFVLKLAKSEANFFEKFARHINFDFRPKWPGITEVLTRRFAWDEREIEAHIDKVFEGSQRPEKLPAAELKRITDIFEKMFVAVHKIDENAVFCSKTSKHEIYLCNRDILRGVKTNTGKATCYIYDTHLAFPSFVLRSKGLMGKAANLLGGISSGLEKSYELSGSESEAVKAFFDSPQLVKELLAIKTKVTVEGKSNRLMITVDRAYYAETIGETFAVFNDIYRIFTIHSRKSV